MNTIAAYLIHENKVYFSNKQAPLSAQFPFTPVTQLIEGIWNRFPEQALRILRNRIFTREKLTPLCEGMIRVAAKRCSEISESALPENLKNGGEGISKLEIQPPIFLAIAPSSSKILNENRASETLSGKTVTAKLFSAEGVLLCTEKNQNFFNRTQHAELRLVRRYLFENQRLLPKNSKIWVSLKPCAMCAAQIFTFSEDPSSLEIIYTHDDPGPMASNSVLRAGSSLHQKAGSPNMRSRLQVENEELKLKAQSEVDSDSTIIIGSG
jgi:tRNA(Arg) A34 adenosine deaminase TadA